MQERLLIAAMALASSEFMFEETRSYVLQRKAFGKTIAHLQVCEINTYIILLQTNEVCSVFFPLMLMF